MAAGAKQKAIGFFRREPVLVISFVCAAASMAFVPPSEPMAHILIGRF